MADGIFLKDDMVKPLFLPTGIMAYPTAHDKINSTWVVL
jgi:hypothetical protein